MKKQKRLELFPIKILHSAHRIPDLRINYPCHYLLSSFANYQLKEPREQFLRVYFDFKRSLFWLFLIIGKNPL